MYPHPTWHPRFLVHLLTLLALLSAALGQSRLAAAPEVAGAQLQPQICSGDDLKQLLNSDGPTIALDGSCRYVLTDKTGENGHIINLFGKKNVTINGNGATIERAADAGDLGLLLLVNSSNVTFVNMTLKGGKAAGALARGGAIYVQSSPNTTFTNVRFEGNTAKDLGGALFLADSPNTLLSGSTFSGNSTETQGGGLFLLDTGAVTIAASTFTGNSAAIGGGLAVQGGETKIDAGVFTSNSAEDGGGLALRGGDTRLYNTILADNQSKGSGAGIHTSGKTLVENSLLIDNRGNPKEALFAFGALTLRSSIVAGHDTAIAAAGGAQNPVVEDYNLFSDNRRFSQLYNPGSVVTSGGHSITSPNIIQQFVAPASYNYRLKATSPAVDRGTTPGLATDADGKARPFGGSQPDIGPYELQGLAKPALVIAKSGPYWVQKNTSFAYQLTVRNNGPGTAAQLRITDTIPEGATPDGAPANGVVSGGTVAWEIGDLAAGQFKTVTYRVTISQSVQGAAYSVASLADPEVSAEGRPIETRVTDALVSSLADSRGVSFLLQPNGFSFANWGGAPQQSDLTADDMLAIFGAGVCTTGTGTGTGKACVLTTSADAVRQKWLKDASGGHCYGLAVGSLQFFLGQPALDGRVTPAQFQPGAASAFDLSRSPAIDNLLTQYFITQGFRPTNPAGSQMIVTDRTPRGLVEFLTANGFRGPGGNDSFVLAFFQRDGNGGHAVTPYALERRGEGSYWLYVYDNNYPNDRDRVVKIDTAANTWIYEGGAINPSAPKSNYEGDAGTRSIYLMSVKYSTTYPKACDFCGQPAPQLAAVARAGEMAFSLSGEGAFAVVDSAGRRTGYDEEAGAYVNEIPGASLEDLLGGLGFNLPRAVTVPTSDTYAIEIFPADTAFGNSSAVGDFSITAPDFAVILEGVKLDAPELAEAIIDPEDPDSLELPASPGSALDTVEMEVDYARRAITFETSDADGDTPALTMAVDQADGKSYWFEVDGVQLSPNSSVEMRYDEATGELLVTDSDGDQPQTYNVEVTGVFPGGATYIADFNNANGGVGSGVEIDVTNWTGRNNPATSIIPNRVYLPLVFR